MLNTFLVAVYNEEILAGGSGSSSPSKRIEEVAFSIITVLFSFLVICWSFFVGAFVNTEFYVNI